LKEILLITVNAKWIHPSLALRLLKANLGQLQDNCEILEFNLRQPLSEMTELVSAARPRILGVSVSIWNHVVSLALLEELFSKWNAREDSAGRKKPVVVIGGPEVTRLPEDAAIFRYADYVIRGEGEEAFRTLCENIARPARPPQFISAVPVKLEAIKSAYHLYSDEDLAKKLVYVEAGRGCPYSCAFCLGAAGQAGNVREFPLGPFLAEMDALVKRGAKTFKFLDRTFNLNIKRAVAICGFFLEKLAERGGGLVAHFEMVPSRFPRELKEALARFPPGTLRLEIGVQTLNAEVSARVERAASASFDIELETLSFLREKTNALIHADLIAGLPGEDLESLGKGFDRLKNVLLPRGEPLNEGNIRAEIQLGLLKLLPGAPIALLGEAFGMRYAPLPPYEVIETAAMSALDVGRVKNFARFWELAVNRGFAPNDGDSLSFASFMEKADSLFAHFGRNWGIDKNELRKEFYHEPSRTLTNS
jgi:radical SAM superfamily enzyme YgiQ (UPF0313 family)